MPSLSTPFPTYNFVVSFSSPGGVRAALGGFTAAFGLAAAQDAEVLPFGFRRANGIATAGSTQKITGSHKVSDVTLKRGVVNSSSLWNWINSARGAQNLAASDLVVVQRSPAGRAVKAWKLSQATPKRYSGPTLGGNGGSDAAIEQLVLTTEAIEIVPPK